MTAEEERDALARALRDVLETLHPTYPSTAGPHGGIGGAAMTPWCHVIRPHTEEHTSLLQQAEDTLRAAFHNAERGETSPAEEAVKRVEALIDPAAWGAAGRHNGDRLFSEKDIRAALASPAPAPQGEQHVCSRWCAQHAALGGPLDEVDR